MRMVTNKKLFLLCVTIVLSLLSRQALSLVCWHCAPCNDPFDKTNDNYTQVVCEGTCMKTVTEFHDLGLYVSRQCSDTPKKDECIERRGENKVCTCGSDLCNGVSEPKSISIATLLAALVAIFGCLLL